MILLVQQLKNKCVHKHFATKFSQPISLFIFFLSFGTNDVTGFLKVTRIKFPLNYRLRFSIVALETFKSKKKGLAM